MHSLNDMHGQTETNLFRLSLSDIPPDISIFHCSVPKAI